MTTISTKGIPPQNKLFHNEPITVYPTSLPLDKIHFWPKNNRTLFTFQRLCRERRKELDQISIEDITRFVAEQDIHKLEDLAKSIGRNGVQVPLIIRNDGLLLDGNRRYFACQWLAMQSRDRKRPIPTALLEIPALIIHKEDLTPTLELKILAEANFIKDLKVAWPLDAQARTVDDYYKQIRKDKKVDRETALDEVRNTFGISRQRVVDLMDSLELSKLFIGEGVDDDDRIKRRGIVEEKFVYFWEFKNKAMKGGGAFDDPAELAEVRDMFFQLIGKGRDAIIKNVKQVEPMIQAKRDKTAWSMLIESKGKKLSVVVNMINEKKEVRKAEDNIRIFHAWLNDVDDLTPKAKSYLREVAKLAAEKVRG
jgi:hypothetical protein